MLMTPHQNRSHYTEPLCSKKITRNKFRRKHEAISSVGTSWAVNYILVFKNPQISPKNLSVFYPFMVLVSSIFWLSESVMAIEKVFDSQFYSLSLNSCGARNNVDTASTDDLYVIHDTAGLCYSIFPSLLLISTPVVFFHLKMESALGFSASGKWSERLYTWSLFLLDWAASI